MYEQGTQSELTDLIRFRTELKYTIAQRAGCGRNALEEDLATVEVTLKAKEQELAAIIPEWKRVRDENNTKRHGAHARLAALNAKCGRLDKFRIEAEWEHHLGAEIASMQQFLTGASGCDGRPRAGTRLHAAVASGDSVNSNIDAKGRGRVEPNA